MSWTFSTMCSHQVPWFFYIFLKFPICSPKCFYYNITLSHMFCPMLCSWKFFKVGKYWNLYVFMFEMNISMLWSFQIFKNIHDGLFKKVHCNIYIHTLQVFVGCFITLLQASSCNEGRQVQI